MHACRGSCSRWVVWPAAVLALLAGEAVAFCSKSSDGSKCHPQLVMESLDFLRPEILHTIAGHVNDPDEWDKPRFIVDQWRRANYATDDHFDNCNFDGSVEKINDRYLREGSEIAGIIEALSPHRRRLKAGAASGHADENYPRLFEASIQWAWVLHAAQDFYSHSNWVELGFTNPDRNLVDRGRESWAGIPSDWRVVREDVIAAQQPLPPKWRMELLPPSSTGAANATTARAEFEARAKQAASGERVPQVIDGSGRRFRMLVSGHGPVPNPWNTCPLAEPISHADLNKDNKTRHGYPEASKMAIGQTRHEWCRLLNLANTKNSPAGAALLMGLMVNPGHAPHPGGTVCAPAQAGGIEVVARVTQIVVRDERKDPGPGQLNFVFAGFTPDFQRSARAQSMIAVSGAPVSPDSLPKPLRFCLNPSEQLVLTVQGWRDHAQASKGQLDEQDNLLAGATGSIPAAAQLVKRSKPFTLARASDDEHRKDLEVFFSVSAERSTNCQQKKDHRMQEAEYAQ